MKKRLFFFVSVILICWTPIFAQEWGKVTPGELALTSIPEDPEADAVVLFDKGEMQITSNFSLEFKRHRRIKILTERGKKYADVAINFWHEDRINKLKAHTILPDGKKVQLNGKDIFEEREELMKQKTFAIPGAQVGAIIEYQYQKSSDYLVFLEPWYFQSEEFTRLSELSIYLPSQFTYHAFFNNVAVVDPIIEKTINPSNPASIIHKFIWRLENVPAIKSEPFMTTLKDYLSSIYFQLNSYRDPYQSFEFIKTWDDIAEMVNQKYKEISSTSDALKDILTDLALDTLSQKEKVKAIYDYVIENFEANPDKGFLGDQLKKTSRVVADKSGSAVEKNLLLINLLRLAGLEAFPVLISTRDHGKFQEKWIQLNQFNHLIVLAREENNSHFMDTEKKCCPFGMLPADDLVNKGLLVDNDHSTIIQIPSPSGINMSYASTNASLNEAGELCCHTILRFENYRAMAEREKLSEHQLEDYIEDLVKNKLPEATIDSFKVNNIDQIDLPLSADVFCRVPNYVQQVGDMIYLCPTFFHRQESNQFKREKRNFPVEYEHTLASLEETELTVPANYKILEAPMPVNINSLGLKFISRCTIEGNKIQHQRYFATNKIYFLPREYSDLRTSYERIVSCDQGQLVLTTSK